MPAQPSRITTVEARRLVRLAKATARQGANRAPSGAPEKLLERHKAKQPSAGGPQTSQGLRLLVVAHRVFGDRLGKYLELYGFGKTVLAAKLKDAKTIDDRRVVLRGRPVKSARLQRTLRRLPRSR